MMRLTISFLSRTPGRTPSSTAPDPSNRSRTNEDDFARHHVVSKQRWTLSVRPTFSHHHTVIASIGCGSNASKHMNASKFESNETRMKRLILSL